MTNTVSYATKRNWDKLNSSEAGKLTKRANKRLSKKRFIPIEYLSDSSNAEKLQRILDDIYFSNYAVESVIFSLAIFLLKTKNILKKKNVQGVLSEYSFELNETIETYDWPTNERDLLGMVYQCLMFEGEKNEKGSYYTPISIVRNMVGNLDFSNNQKFLDPCCGSGSFLLELDANPDCIFGVDNDPIAVFIAKINLLIKYPDETFYPHIECRDYLEKMNLFSLNSEILGEKFDYIMTNPPWGALANGSCAVPEILSNETFSCFFVKAFWQLKSGGIVRFLFPESVTNVKVHKDIRQFMLSNCCIDTFTIYDNSFTGVTTKYIDICCSNNCKKETAILYRNNEIRSIDVSSFFDTENLVFNFLSSQDLEIVEKVKSFGKYDLSKSIWALGVVTGDNKKKIHHEKSDGMEKIYTGKEIHPYFLSDSENYIFYKREELQQVAKEEFYRAPEKLVYKFISNKLVFAYDDKQRLFLNSANILIPNISGMDIKTVLAFLNSELYQFLYIQLFGEIKILKGNLIELPFPELNEEQNAIISESVSDLLIGNCDEETIQKMIYDIFQLSQEQIDYIRRSLYGKVA